MNLDDVLQLQVLKQKAMAKGGVGQGSLTERMLDQAETGGQLKQMCAKVSVELHDQVHNLCGILDLSKREFIEAAVVEAVVRAHEVIERNGGLEAMGWTPKEAG